MGEDTLDQILLIVINGPPFKRWGPTKAVRLWDCGGQQNKKGRCQWLFSSKKAQDQSQSQENKKIDWNLSDWENWLESDSDNDKESENDLDLSP